MNSYMKILKLAGTATLLTCLLLTGHAFAQERVMDRQDRIERASDPEAGLQQARIDCDEVNWHRDMLAEYPWSEDACHDVVTSAGQNYARFEIDYLGQNPDGTIRAEFIGPDERSHGTVNLQPGDNQMVMLDGQPHSWGEVFEGQRLSLFVPEGEFGFAGAPDAPAGQLARRADDTDDEQMRLAEAEERPFDRQRELPATAGPLPLLGLAGLLSLLGGLGLTMRRRLGRTTA